MDVSERRVGRGVRPAMTRLGVWLVFVVGLVEACAAVQPRIGMAVVGDDVHARRLRDAMNEVLGELGYQVKDLSVEYDYFNGISPLPTGNINAARPGFWPSDLADAWDQGIAACLARAGAPPYGTTNREAFLCGRQLAAALWQRYLDHQRLARFVVAPVIEPISGARLSVEGVSFVPDETVAHTLATTLTLSVMREQVQSWLEEMLAGKGKSITRRFERELPRPPSAALPRREPDVTGFDLSPVPLPASCSASLPPDLLIEPATDWIAMVTAARWRASVATRDRSADALGCSIQLIDHGALMGTSMRDFVVNLTCGGVSHVTRHASIDATHRGFVERVTAELIAKLGASLCAG